MTTNAAQRKAATSKPSASASQLAELLGTDQADKQVETVRALLDQLQIAARPPTVLLITGNVLTQQVDVSCPTDEPIEAQLALLSQAQLTLVRQSIEAKAKAAQAAQETQTTEGSEEDVPATSEEVNE